MNDSVDVLTNDSWILYDVCNLTHNLLFYKFDEAKLRAMAGITKSLQGLQR
jgi:hypothetical protein